VNELSGQQKEQSYLFGHIQDIRK